MTIPPNPESSHKKWFCIHNTWCLAQSVGEIPRLVNAKVALGKQLELI